MYMNDIVTIITMKQFAVQYFVRMYLIVTFKRELLLASELSK